MFSRFLNKIADAGKNNSPPDDAGVNIAAEGFLCPSCMLGFPNPELLQDHYESSHVNSDAANENSSGELHICSACKMRLGSTVELESHFTRHHTVPKRQESLEGLSVGSLKQELEELRTTLKEERWYSNELTKEISRLQSILKFGKDNADGKSDIDLFYQNQIKILEESKELALSEAVLLKEHLSDSREELIRVIQDKDKLEQKAAAMAGDLADLKSRLDEVAEERVEFKNQLKDSQKQVLELQVSVEQRLGSEDALLLRQELVTVQNLMDQLTQEKELEKEELQKHCHKLEEEKASLTLALQIAPNQTETKRLNSLVDQLKADLRHKESDLTIFKLNMENRLEDLEKTSAADLTIAKEQQTAAESKITELKELLEESSTSLAAYKEASNACVQETHVKAQEKCQKHLQQLLTMKAEAEQVSQKLHQRECEIQELNQLLERSQADVQLKEISIRELSEILEERSNTLEQSQMELQKEQISLSKAILDTETLKEQNERLETERTELYQKIQSGDGAKTAIHQLQHENLDLQEKIRSIVESNYQIQGKAQKDLEELNVALKQETERTHKTEKETDILRNKLAENETQTNYLLQKLSDMKEEAVRKEMSTSEEKTKYCSEKLALDHLLKIKDTELEDMQKMLDSLNIELKEVRHRFSEEHTLYSEMKSRFDNTARDLKRITSTSEAQAASLKLLQSELLSAKSLLEEFKDREQKLNTDLKQSELSMEKLKEDLSYSKEKIESSAAELLALNQKHVVQALEITNLKEELQQVHQQAEEGRKNLNKTKDEMLEVKRLKLEETEKTKSLEVLCSELTEQVEKTKEKHISEAKRANKLQETLNGAEESLNLCKEIEVKTAKHLADLEQKFESQKHELIEQNNNVSHLTSQNHHLQTEITKSLEDLENAKSTFKSLELKCGHLENRLSEKEEEAKEECQRANLAEEAKALIIQQKLHIQGELKNTVDKCKLMEINQQSVIIELEIKEKELQCKITALMQQLDEKDSIFARVQQSCEDTKSQFEAQASVLSENLSTLQQDLQIEKNKTSILETKLDELGGCKLELEAKLENALEERRALLDRCLRSEDESEKLRNTTAELRHKLDDTLAALHELGRENQSLQIDNTKLLQRKWAEDAEVTHCTACRKQFTVTVRKHHCRSCGSIFCNECSSRTATIASYKKAVRVCDGCFDEVGQ